MKKIDIKKIFKNILFIILAFILFVSICIVSINIISKNKSYKLSDAIKAFSEIENGQISFTTSKISEIDGEKERINFTYKTQFDKNYNYENENVLALKGEFGAEVESMKIGVYLPINLICNNDIIFYSEIEEVYQTILQIPENNTQIHGNLKPILKDYLSIKNKGIKDEDVQLNDFYKTLEQSLYNYSKKEQKNFLYTSSDEQDVFTGAVGRFTKNIDRDDFNYILEDFKKNTSNKTYINVLEGIIKKIEGEYTLYIYVENNLINKVILKNQDSETTISFKALNSTKLSFDDIDLEEYGLDINEYLEKTNSNILGFFGYNSDGSVNIKSLLQLNFKELMSYMYLCIQYAEAGDNASSQDYLTLMSSLIDSIENTNGIAKKDKDEFETYMSIYKLLMQYAIIYRQECFAQDENEIIELDKQLYNVIIELTDKLNSIGVDIKETFGQILETDVNTENNEEDLSFEVIGDENLNEEVNGEQNNNNIEIIGQDNIEIIGENNNQDVVVITPDNVN